MLNQRILWLAGSGRVIRLDHVFSAFTGDVIGRICSETPPNLIQGEDFGRDWYVMTLPIYEFYRCVATILADEKAGII